MQRFCQQCVKFHDVAMFEGIQRCEDPEGCGRNLLEVWKVCYELMILIGFDFHRSCRMQLDKHNARRRRKAEQQQKSKQVQQQLSQQSQQQVQQLQSQQGLWQVQQNNPGAMAPFPAEPSGGYSALDAAFGEAGAAPKRWDTSDGGSSGLVTPPVDGQPAIAVASPSTPGVAGYNGTAVTATGARAVGASSSCAVEVQEEEVNDDASRLLQTLMQNPKQLDALRRLLGVPAAHPALPPPIRPFSPKRPRGMAAPQGLNMGSGKGCLPCLIPKRLDGGGPSESTHGMFPLAEMGGISSLRPFLFNSYCFIPSPPHRPA